MWVGLSQVVTDTGVKTNFTVELAYCTYTNGDDVLKIAIHEAGHVHDATALHCAPGTCPRCVRVRVRRCGLLSAAGATNGLCTSSTSP